MANLYVTSAETFSGKSALCVGLGLRFQEDGLKVGYMKPVNTFCQVCEGLPSDEDVLFARSTFEMTEPPELLAPVALTPAKVDAQLRGATTDYEARLKQAMASVSASRDVMVLEGGRSLSEGYLVGLSPRRVAELLAARVLFVLRFDDTLLVDHALMAREYIGQALLGYVINEVPRGQMDRVNELIVPFLAAKGMRSLGVIPKDQLLAAPTVAELAEGLSAEILCCHEKTEELVEHLLVGAMSVESALSYFRRQPNKAVVTGGDRADIQLAALETSTRCLILTGNLYPSPAVLNRAEELGVPVLLSREDTLATTEIIDGYFGRSRFQQPQKISRFSSLLSEHVEMSLLYEGLGLQPKK